MQNPPRRAWARTGALLLFLLTRVLLLASLNQVRSEQTSPFTPGSASQLAHI
jgi:hypothetical protein